MSEGDDFISCSSSSGDSFTGQEIRNIFYLLEVFAVFFLYFILYKENVPFVDGGCFPNRL